MDLVRKVLEKSEMNENSAMVLNLGLHYIESTSLANYRHLLNGVIDLLNERNAETGDLKHKARIIWKTTTSMNKEKDTGSRLRSDWQRFLNLPVRPSLYCKCFSPAFSRSAYIGLPFLFRQPRSQGFSLPTRLHP